jgi:hypothetical protein
VALHALIDEALAVLDEGLSEDADELSDSGAAA